MGSACTTRKLASQLALAAMPPPLAHLVRARVRVRVGVRVRARVKVMVSVRDRDRAPVHGEELGR